MGKRTNIILTSTMMGIATTACAFCMAQSANAAETSASSTDVTSTSTASSSANVTVDYSKNNSSITTSNTETSSTTASSIATASIASSNTTTSNTTNGGGSALDSASAKPAKFIGEDRSMPASEESREASTDSTTTNDPSLAWTREDFNITPDGKQIGYRKDINVPAHDGKPASTENIIVPGLNEKGLAKLKKNHHIVIPEGIEVIHECAFTGRANKVGNHHEHVDGKTYIEGVTLPQSLKIIEYGAFGWNKIKGTVTIPKSVISIHSAAFVANEIEKVVFEGVLDGKGKEHDTDADPYYLSGVGEKAFQGNKISEIVVKGNLGNYQLFPSNNPQKSDSVFDNQNPGPFTIEVGEEYKSPIKITQESGRHTISIIEGFKENGSPVQIENSSYFQKNNEGKYVATQPGTLQGQCLFYDIINGQFRVIGTSQFTYNILPKSKIYTVTFVNDTDQNYAKVQVKEGKTINNNSVLNQVMPDNPSKAGYTFRGWSTDKTGKDKTKEFSAATQVTGDMTVYAIYTPTPAVLNAVPTLIVQDKTITEGDPLDLRSLIVSATDKEDGDLKNKVQITNNGGFDNSKVGSYVITFSVTDNGGATATASATVTVTKKPTPPTPPTPPAPAPEPEPTPTSVPELSVPVSPAPILTPAEAESEPEPAPAPSQPEQPEQQQAQRVVKHLPKTGSAVSTVINYLFASVTAGIFAFVEARKSLRRYSKHARKN